MRTSNVFVSVFVRFLLTFSHVGFRVRERIDVTSVRRRPCRRLATAGRTAPATWRTRPEPVGRLAGARLGATAVWTEDVLTADQESASDEGRVTLVTLETVVVPVALIKRNKLGRAQTSDGFRAADASLGEVLGEAVGTVRLLIT